MSVFSLKIYLGALRETAGNAVPSEWHSRGRRFDSAWLHHNRLKLLSIYHHKVLIVASKKAIKES
jgi:hypothetical protein